MRCTAGKKETIETLSEPGRIFILPDHWLLDSLFRLQLLVPLHRTLRRLA